MNSETVRSLQVTPRYKPPETYQGDVSKRVNPHLDQYTHIILVDADMRVPEQFYELPNRYPDADIITLKVVPRLLVNRLWEAMTYGIRLERLRLRGSPVIYSTRFLKSVGGYPDIQAPDTWLYNHAGKVVQAPLTAYHEEQFNLTHSINKQILDGKARAEMNQQVWRVAAHSIIRLRPLVLFTYFRHRKRKPN